MKKNNGKAKTMLAGLMEGLAINLITTLTGAVILAKLIDSEVVDWNNVGYGVIPILVLSSFWGSMVSYAKIKRKKLQVFMLSALWYWLTLLAITVIFFDGNFHAIGITLLLIFAGCGSGYLLKIGKGSNKPKKQKRKYCKIEQKTQGG